MNKKIENWFKKHKRKIECITDYGDRWLGYFAAIITINTIMNNGFGQVICHMIFAFYFLAFEIAGTEISKKLKKAKQKDLKEREVKKYE